MNLSASIHFEYLSDDEGAYQRLSRAASLAPDDLRVLANYAEFLLASGRLPQAVVAAARAREHPGARSSDKAYVRAAMDFVIFGAELLSGNRVHALQVLDMMESDLKTASAFKQESSWSYAGLRRSLARHGADPSVRAALSQALNCVASNGARGSIDVARRLVGRPQPG